MAVMAPGAPVHPGKIPSDEHITWLRGWHGHLEDYTFLYQLRGFPLPCDVFVGV